LPESTHERAALAWLDVLELYDGPQVPVEVEDQSVLEVVRGGHDLP
jgi:hypothetical protein